MMTYAITQLLVVLAATFVALAWLTVKAVQDRRWNIAGATAWCVFFFSMTVMVGCTGQQTAAELIGVVGTAVTSLEAFEGNAALATKLQSDFQAAETAVMNWKSGTPAQDVIEALNLVEDDLNLVPISTQDTALIDLAIGTVDQIVALFPAPVVSPPAFHSLVSNGSYIVPAVPHRHPVLAKTPKNAKDFRKLWDVEAKQHHLPPVPAKK